MSKRKRFDPTKIAPLVRGSKIVEKRFYYFCTHCGNIIFYEDKADNLCNRCLGVDENDDQVFCPSEWGDEMICMTQDDFVTAITPLIESYLATHRNPPRKEKKEK